MRTSCSDGAVIGRGSRLRPGCLAGHTAWGAVLRDAFGIEKPLKLVPLFHALVMGQRDKSVMPFTPPSSFSLAFQSGGFRLRTDARDDDDGPSVLAQRNPDGQNGGGRLQLRSRDSAPQEQKRCRSCPTDSRKCPTGLSSLRQARTFVRCINGKAGWGGRDRTSEWRNQNPLPYRLATPQQWGRL